MPTTVDALNASRGDVDRVTTLLGRLEAQAGRLAAAEATMARVESLGERVIATTDRPAAARTTLERIDQLHQDVGVRVAAIAEMLSGASSTVGQLQRFVVEVMLLVPKDSPANGTSSKFYELTSGS